MPREILYDTNLQILISSDDKQWFKTWCENNDTDIAKNIRRHIKQLRAKEAKRVGK